MQKIKKLSIIYSNPINTCKSICYTQQHFTYAIYNLLINYAAFDGIGKTTGIKSSNEAISSDMSIVHLHLK